MALPAVDSIRSEVRSLQPYVPGKPIEELERELGIAGVIIRPMTSFGLAHEYTRISVGTMAENERLVEVLRRIA